MEVGRREYIFRGDGRVWMAPAHFDLMLEHELARMSMQVVVEKRGMGWRPGVAQQ